MHCFRFAHWVVDIPERRKNRGSRKEEISEEIIEEKFPDFEDFSILQEWALLSQ